MKTSKYEQHITNLLNMNNVIFQREYSFSDLKGFKESLRFDFVIYNPKTKVIDFLLEVNGEQHYKEISIWGGKRGLQKRQEYDRKKMSYALSHHIPMICIPYWVINKELTYAQILTNPEYRVTSIWHNDKILKQKEK